MLTLQKRMANYTIPARETSKRAGVEQAWPKEKRIFKG
jgi:hypothetical protein